MKTLARSVAAPGAVGTPIALPWRSLNEFINLRTKELVVVAGAPGGGKSTLAANLAINFQVPVLYCAQDSPASIVSRMTGLTLGMDVNRVQNDLADERGRDRIIEQMRDKHPTLVVNRGSIELSRLKDMLGALAEWIGTAPPVVVIDNLIDLIVPGHTHHETTFYSAALPELKRIALDYDCCVIALHHVTRGGGSEHGQGQSPLALTDLLYGGEREARHVWGVYNDGHDRVKVQILKQRDGPADPGGGMEIGLRWFPRLGKLTSWEG